MISQLYQVQSRPTVDFLEALNAAGAFNQSPFVSTSIQPLYGLPPINSRWFLIRAIGYQAVEDVGLEVDFYADAAASKFLARYQFASANGRQQGGAGLFNFYVDGLAIPYYDADTANTVNPPVLHAAMQNVDTVAKSAAGAGAVTLTLWAEPMQFTQG